MKAASIILAGGGTGGHLFPGLAVADEFCRREPERQVVVVGTGRPVERRAVAAAGYPLHLLAAKPLRGKSRGDKILSLSTIPVSMAQSYALLARIRPSAVIGLGGYASGPMVLSAASSFIPTAIMEQNSIPGSTNRILGKMRAVDRAYLTFDVSRKYFKSQVCRVLGNPVRKSLIELAGSPLITKPLSILVLGGSQGAQRLNLSVPGGLSIAKTVNKKIKILHQTGDAMVEGVRRRYDELGLRATVVSFIDDMASAYQKASLVICRAGATTLSELAVIGRPAILVPFPHAIDDHQRKNAQELEKAGAAIMVSDREATPERLASEVDELLKSPDEQLEPMAHAAAKLGRANATEQVVDDLEELIGVR